MPSSVRGGSAEFAEFARSAATPLARTAYLLSGNRETAAELVQEALTRVYVAWRRVRREEALAYTRRVLVNLDIDRRRRRPAVPVEEYDRAVPNVAEAASDDRDEVVRMLATLPETQRRVIVLRYFEDLPEAAVAAQLGISLGTVKSACSRGLAALRAHYSPVSEGEER
jgi:RNA polymerase sigma-70 factor (sigma-E family)